MTKFRKRSRPAGAAARDAGSGTCVRHQAARLRPAAHAGMAEQPGAQRSACDAPSSTDTAGCCSTRYIYDLGCSAGIRIRELAPSNPNLGGAVDPDREAAFREKAADDITGLSVWASAVMLGRWVHENAELLAEKDCLELGAGTGLGGLVAAALPLPAPGSTTTETASADGQRVRMAAAASSVVLSDFAEATMANLRHNIDANCISLGGEGDHWVSPTGTSVSLVYMDWDQPSTWPVSQSHRTNPDGSACSLQKYDVLLGADLLYTRSYARKVASVAAQLLRPGGILVVATPRERAGFETLIQTVPSSWECTQSPVPTSWRTSPFRDIGDKEAALLMPEFAVDAELYPLCTVQFKVPIDSATAAANEMANAKVRAEAKASFDFTDGDESEGPPGDERPHALYSFDEFLMNVPCGDDLLDEDLSEKVDWSQYGEVQTVFDVAAEPEPAKPAGE